MFALSELSKFQSEQYTVRIIKPWWNVVTDYLVKFMLMISILVGGIQLASDSLDCLPAVNCFVPTKNVSLSFIRRNHKTCVNFYSSHPNVTDGKATTVVTELKNNFPYAKYVNSECGKNSVHWFASYFAFVLFGQAFLLLIVDNFWLKFPNTASVLENFSALVLECYNSPGTNFDLPPVFEKSPNRNETSQVENMQNELKLSETEKCIRAGKDNGCTPSSKNEISFDVATAVAVTTLYEKVKQFKERIKSSKKILTIYLIQTAIQATFTSVFLVINIVNMKNVKGLVRCSVNVYIPIEHDYFICSYSLAPMFEAALVLFLLVLAVDFCTLLFIFGWTIRTNETWLNDVRRPAAEDMDFLVQLLYAYDKWYAARFAVFMSDKNERKLKAFIMENEWPLEKLERCCKETGTQLKLSRLYGIPQTLFFLGHALKFLELSHCGPLQDNDFQFFEELLKLHKLSIVNCGLTKIPEKIFDMTWLLHLELAHNSIKSIQAGIIKLNKLEILNISSNELETIDESIGELTELQTLLIRDNPKLKISALKNVLECQQLKRLDICPLSESQKLEFSKDEMDKLIKVSRQKP